ncbi:hypothetical protein JCM10908_003591 [Rhodotorula pacifica]|uniref:Zn(II)2Cys6 transcription factor n=1 Tax=Rhodotorula pacifica TaxID=1495444 RepID=UPI00316E6F06
MPVHRGSAAPGEADRRSMSAGAAPLDEDDLVDGKAKFACEYCKRRKLRCTRDVPNCDFCRQHRQECIYTRIVRTPLTRKNLDAAEQRIRRLEELLEKQRQDPDGTLSRQQSIFDDPEHESGPTTSSSRRSISSSHDPTLSLATAGPSGVPPALDLPHQPSLSSSHVASRQETAFLSHQQLLSPPVAVRLAPPIFNPALAHQAAAAPASDIPPLAQPATSSAAGPISGLTHNLAARLELPPPSVTSTETPVEAEEDGMGSLTVDQGPNASGYLGSLSGAGLLRFLQRCATDVDLASKATLKGVTSPSSTMSSTAQIAPEQLASYIEAYFSVFHLQYPLVHQATFRAQLGDIVPRTGGGAWTLLYTVILGLGSMCINGDAGDGSETLMLYDKAVGLVSAAMFETSNLTAVQAFTLLANYAQKLSHVSQGTVFLGIALRMAINLGLHCEASSKNMSLFEQEQRRRVWYILFCFESGAGITFGHPSTLPTFGVDVWPVLNVPDTVFTPATTIRPAPSSGATAYSSTFYQACFHQLAGQVLNCLTVNPHLPLDDVLRLYHDVDSFQASLPPFFFSAQPAWFDFARHRLAWRLDNLRMVILRQTFLKVSLAPGPVSPEEEKCWGKCVDCAAEVIRSVQRFTSSGSRCMMELWYALHFVIPSTFLPLIALRVRPSSPTAIEWLDVVQSAKSILERISHALLKPLASRCLTIISAVANLSEGGRPYPEIQPAPLDADFTNFLEMLAKPMEMDGMPTQALQAPGLLPDLDALFQWFTPAGSPQPQ